MTGLPVEITHAPNIATYPPGATFGPRLLRDHEFVWLIEGDAEYHYETDGQSHCVAAPQGSLILCRNGFKDSFLWDRKRRTRHGFFHFRLQMEDASFGPESTWPVVRACHPQDIFTALTGHLLTWANDGHPAQRNLLGAALLGSFLTGQSQLDSVAPARTPDPVERCLELIYRLLEEDARAPISLERMAKTACVTPEHLCRVFRKATGRSPLETVRLARLDRAAVLLARSNYGVAQVAALTGFTSPYHFSRVFKEAYGVAPRELQRAVARGEMAPLPRLLSTARPQSEA